MRLCLSQALPSPVHPSLTQLCAGRTEFNLATGGGTAAHAENYMKYLKYQVLADPKTYPSVAGFVKTYLQSMDREDSTHQAANRSITATVSAGRVRANNKPLVDKKEQRLLKESAAASQAAAKAVQAQEATDARLVAHRAEQQQRNGDGGSVAVSLPLCRKPLPLPAHAPTAG